jgi:RNase P protein component
MGNIIWLASYPKSGNTWLRAFLANLVANRASPVPLDELSNYAEDEANPDMFTLLSGRPSSSLDMDQISELRPQVHAAMADRSAGTGFVKTHNMIGSFNGHPLHNMQVTAGAIYVVRNPLDVAVSMTHHFGIDMDAAIDRLGNENVATANDELFVSQILGSWSMHVQGWADIRHDRVIVLRYEDMVEKPLKAFVKVAKLVGVAQDRARIERAIRHADFRSLSAMERQHGFVEASDKGARFFRKGRTNEWRELLTREQVQRVIDAHRQQMQRFGYLPAGYR